MPCYRWLSEVVNKLLKAREYINIVANLYKSFQSQCFRLWLFYLLEDGAIGLTWGNLYSICHILVRCYHSEVSYITRYIFIEWPTKSSFTVLLLSSTFMDQVPSIYPILVSSVVSSVFGGAGLFVFGCFTYMTVTTKEEHRTSRFGVFAIVVNLLGFTESLAGVFETLGYQGDEMCFLWS